MRAKASSVWRGKSPLVRWNSLPGSGPRALSHSKFSISNSCEEFEVRFKKNGPPGKRAES